MPVTAVRDPPLGFVVVVDVFAPLDSPVVAVVVAVVLGTARPALADCWVGAGMVVEVDACGLLAPLTARLASTL